jgi:hypothetical protein
MQWKRVPLPFSEISSITLEVEILDEMRSAVYALRALVQRQRTAPLFRLT